MNSRYLSGLLVVLSLILLHEPGQSQDERRTMSPGENVAGTVTSIGKSSLTIAPLRGGDPITITISDSTRLMKDREPAKLSDIKTGDTVFARGKLSGNAMEALLVGVLPPEMAERMKQGGGMAMGMGGGRTPGQGQAFSPEDMGKKFIAGEVKAMNETHLTIARPDGQTQDIEVDENTSFKRGNESVTLADIKVGDFVHGPGELKNNVFTPKELRVGRPRMQMWFGSQQAPAGSTNQPADKKPSSAPPN